MNNTELNYEELLKTTQAKPARDTAKLDRDLSGDQEISAFRARAAQLQTHIPLRIRNSAQILRQRTERNVRVPRRHGRVPPVQETKKRRACYRSTHENKMHACGHDGHMAMVLTLGQYVNTLDELKCNVLLIFQPAEETLGGANETRQSGIFTTYNVTKVFGIHMWPFIDAGKIASSMPHALMPKSAEINIDIYGKAAHGTAPYERHRCALHRHRTTSDVFMQSTHRSRVTVPRFPEGVGDLPRAPQKEPEDKTIIHIGKMVSGYARNIVSDYTHFLGTVRAFSEENFNMIINLLKSTLTEIADEYGCSTEFSNSEGYPPVINDVDLYNEILPLLRELPGGYEEFAEPLVISEDFSFYGQLRARSIFPARHRHRHPAPQRRFRL